MGRGQKLIGFNREIFGKLGFPKHTPLAPYPTPPLVNLIIQINLIKANKYDL